MENEKEINIVFGIVHRLFKAGVNMKDIGIITPYNAQKYRLYDKFEDECYDNLKIESVDGFQGMEKDYIIISTVRSNVSGKIGFLSLTKKKTSGNTAQVHVVHVQKFIMIVVKSTAAINQTVQ